MVPNSYTRHYSPKVSLSWRESSFHDSEERTKRSLREGALDLIIEPALRMGFASALLEEGGRSPPLLIACSTNS